MNITAPRCVRRSIFCTNTDMDCRKINLNKKLSNQACLLSTGWAEFAYMLFQPTHLQGSDSVHDLHFQLSACTSL